MGLDDTVRSAVAVANSVTRDLQEEVLHYPWIYQTQLGENKYDPQSPISRKGIVQQFIREIRMADGRFMSVKAKITFLEDIPANGAEGRVEPIDNRDKIVLADGTTGPIVEVKGLRDPGRANAFLLEVFLGTGVGVG